MQKVNYWIKASRPQTLIASLAPVLSNSILCYKYYSFSYIIFVLTVISAILIQIMTNFINDLYDYKKGSDKTTRLGPDRMIQKGHLNQLEIKKAIVLLLCLSVFSGLYLVLVGGWIILSIGLSSFLFAYLYTATKFSIAYNGLGEVFVFIYFGIIASMGTSYLQSGFFIHESFLIGVVFGFLNISLLVINNLRDYNEDIASNKMTLIVLLGKNFGKLELLISLFAPLIIIFYLDINLRLDSIFYFTFPLFILPIYIYIYTVKNKSFLISRALPFTSLYIFLFTCLLSYGL